MFSLVPITLTPRPPFGLFAGNAEMVGPYFSFFVLPHHPLPSFLEAPSVLGKHVAGQCDSIGAFVGIRYAEINVAFFLFSVFLCVKTMRRAPEGTPPPQSNL